MRKLGGRRSTEPLVSVTSDENLDLLPLKMNLAKKAKITEWQRALVQRLKSAGLIGVREGDAGDPARQLHTNKRHSL